MLLPSSPFNESIQNVIHEFEKSMLDFVIMWAPCRNATVAGGVVAVAAIAVGIGR